MKKQRIPINSAQDLNDVLSDMFEEFLISVVDNKGMTTPAIGDLPTIEYEEGIQWYYTDKAMILIERWKMRMEKIFKKYFPDHEFKPVTTYYKEF